MPQTKTVWLTIGHGSAAVEKSAPIEVTFAATLLPQLSR